MDGEVHNAVDSGCGDLWERDTGANLEVESPTCPILLVAHAPLRVECVKDEAGPGKRVPAFRDIAVDDHLMRGKGVGESDTE